MKKILSIFGTRPEAIKMAPIINRLKDFPDDFDSKVCVTGQHREMLDQVLDLFEISADFDLNIMKSSQTLTNVTCDVLSGLDEIFKLFNPDIILVHGDTTTTMAGSIASFYSGAKVCHVEAGLRTHNKLSPFPEEINRQITGRVCDYHFAPTTTSKENLLKENIQQDTILVTGNTVIDALLDSVERVNQEPSVLIKQLSTTLREKELILVTGHRRENHGEGFVRICEALKEIALDDENRLIVYPVHLNPKVQKPVKRILSGIDNVILIDPLAYQDFIWMMNRAKIIITDSGGVQEEAPSLGKPVLVMRDTTERPEAVDAGTVILVGTNKELIVTEALDLLNNATRFQQMSLLHNPYGDGKACKRIVDFINKLD